VRVRVRELAQPLGLQVHDEPEQARAVLVSLARGDVLLAQLHLDLLAARVGRREAHLVRARVRVRIRVRVRVRGRARVGKRTSSQFQST